MTKTAAILVARLIFGLVFLMAAAFKFKFIGIDATAGEIAAAGFPFPVLLAVSYTHLTLPTILRV